MSKMCSGAVLPSCCMQCFSEPFDSRFITFPPHPLIQSIDLPLSTKPSTSTLSSISAICAYLQIIFTASRSPSETRADATSILSTLTSRKSIRANMSFSCGTKDTPLVCSPSRSVESIISILLFFTSRWVYIITVQETLHSYFS